MAKKSSENNSSSSNPSINPQNIIADAYMEVDERWAAQFLSWAYIYTNSSPFAQPLAKYRGIDLGIGDEAEMKRYFEPNENVPISQKADLMRTDWRISPLVHAVNMIIQKNIEGMPIELKVGSGSDKLSVSKKEKQKLKIKTRRALLEVVNYIKKMTNEAPYDEDTNLEIDEEGNEIANESLSLIDSIKNEAVDDMDFNLLNEADMLKDGVEISHEELISFYLNSSDFLTNVSPLIISDFMKVNALTYRFYTSVVTGLPMVQYIDPAAIYTSNFYRRNGADMDYWYYVQTVTWSTFMQMVGGKLSPETCKLVYETNRNMYYNTRSEFPVAYQFQNTFTPNGMYNNWYAYNYALMNTYIQLGYFEVKKHVYDEKTDKYYDTIKKFYYLPLISGFKVDNEESFIFDLGDLQDMYRHGTNLQNADFSLIIYKDMQRQSFYDAQQGDFLRLNILYNQYLNTLANFIPEGVAFAEETIRELAEEIKAEEEDLMREQGHDITSLSLQGITEKIIRNYVLTGRGVFKLRSGDNDEQRLDRPTFIMENKILLNLQGLMQEMFSVYNTMLMALGVPASRLGQDPKPRQTQKGTELANQTSDYSTASIEEAYTFALKQFGQRMLYYNQQVITEFNKNGEPETERAEEMKALIGTKGTVWLEVYKDMPIQRCTLQIQNAPSTQERIQLMALCVQYEATRVVPKGTTLQAQDIPNFKLAKAFVTMSIRKQERINIENAKRAMEIQGQQQQAAQAQAIQIASQQKQEDAALEARILALETQLKTQGQIEVKDKTNQNRLQENQQKTELNIQQEQAKKEMETY